MLEKLPKYDTDVQYVHFALMLSFETLSFPFFFFWGGGRARGSPVCLRANGKQ